ncbi:MAG: calcium-binding protein, partial [Gammaproteobacteria bacterium]
DGDDDLYGGTRGTAWGSDWLFGGAGDDYLNSATWFDADLPTQFDDPGDFLLGGDGRDVAVGNGGADVLLGGDGADFLSGRGNHDVIDGGAGDDLVSGGGGDDRLFGGDGDDILLGQTDLWGSTARNWSTTWVRDAAGRIVDFAATGVFGAPRGADDADLLRGGGGNDLLDGGDGDDALHGDAGADVLFGGRGADRLDGGPGDDHLYGDGLEAVAVPGDGDDVLDGGDGDDALHGGGGADRLAGGAGDDRLFGGDGADRLAGNVGDDLLEGGGGSDHLQGDDGDDALRGDAGDDVLEGGAGNDGLEGGGGADVLAGGTGDDQLAGGDGHDTYLYYPGDGHDRIVDTAGWDTVILADPGALANAVQRREGADLVLHFSATDSLHLVDWAAGAIERVVAGERVLYADAVTTEPLDPAQPRDGTWVFASASGGLTIPAGDSAHTLVLGRGIEPTDLAGVVGADGTWRATIDGTSLAIGGWESSALSHFRFADGSTLDRYPIELAVRYAPHLAEPLVDRVAVPGYALDFAIPPFAFARGDFGPLQFSASRADGTPLPSWLDFAADGARFTATPAPSSAPGALEIAVTARNMRGDVVRDVFTLDVRGWPFSAPSVLHPLLVDGRRAAWLGPPPADTEHSMPSARGSGVGFAPAAPSPVPRAPSDARGVGDVDGDGYGDFHLRERFVVDGRAEVRDHIVLGRAGGLPVVLDTLAEAAAGRAFEIVGAAPFTAVDSGDVDGDGRSDLLVRSAAGIYNIVYGSAARPAPVALDTLTPAQGYAFTASGMVRVLDLDGDGLADIFTPRAVLRGEAPRRRAGVIDLQGSGFDGEPLITAGAGPGFELAPDAGFDFNRLTDIHAIGDFDGDGYDDFFVVAAPEYGIDPAYHVVRGAGGGVRAGFDLDTAPLITLGGDLSRGGTVTHGDFNGDGLSDLVLVAAAQADARNEQRVVFGTRDTAITHLDTGALDGSNGFIVDGGWDVAGIGSAREGMLAVALGDINGDGIDDLAFSSRTTLDVPTHAYLPVVYGRDTPFPARFDLTALDIDDGFHAMLPFGAHGTLHVQPRALGDVDGDGHADFLVFGDSGSGYLVRGQPALAAVLVNGTPGADHLEVVTAGSFVQAGAGDDVIEVRNPLGVTIDAGSGDDIIRFDGDVARYEVPLGTTPAAWARQQPTFVHTGDGAKLIHLGAAPLALHIVATEDGRGNDLSLGQGYRPALLRLRPGSIKLDFGAQLGEVHLENFDPLDILGGPRSIDRVLFDDGTVLSYEALVARGFDIGGSNGADTLYGTNLVDRISGHGGADVLDARAGDDILRGGRGNDTYLVRRGEGSDLVYDVGGTDTVQFLDGITLADLSVQRLAKDLHIAIAGGGELRVRGQFSTPSLAVERLAFDDGSRWDVRTLTNSPPFVFRPPAPLPVDPGLPFEHRLPPLTFLDREADRLTYTLTDAGGGAPPGWLTFDPVLRILRGTLPHEQSHDVELVLGADDGLARTDTRLVLDVGVPPA